MSAPPIPDLDLLIRSASSLLSIIGQQLEPTSPHQDIERSVRFLDRIALLFVTKPKEDVSALSVVLAPNSSVLVDVVEDSIDWPSAESTPVAVDYLLVSKNSKKGQINDGVSIPSEISGAPFPAIDNSKPARNAGDDWLHKCCKYGPMGPIEHAAQLQYLLGRISVQEGIMSEGAINFTRYVYYQCLPKIEQRLNIPVTQGGVPFWKLFAVGEIDNAALVSRLCPDDSLVLKEKVLRHGDGWMAPVWKSVFGKSPTFEKRNGVEYLIRDGRTTVFLHRLICWNFEKLSTRLDEVRQGRRVYNSAEQVRDDYLHRLCEALDGVAYYMDFFANLLKSPCFWKLLHHPVLSGWVLDKASGQQRRDQEASYDTDDEDLMEVQTEAASDPVTAVTRWLQCATQWSISVSEIVSPNKESTKILLATGVRIVSVKVPTVNNSKTQASLRELLEHVSDGSSFHWTAAMTTLRRIANAMATCQNPGANWNKLTTGNWDHWQTSFTGKHHCESVLASLLEMESQDELVKITKAFTRLIRAKKAIGVSKRCCYCCALYIRHLNPQLSFGGTSGKVYPWVLPLWFRSDDVGRVILEQLTRKLRERLVSMGTPRTARRDSGSDSGRSDGDGPAVTRPVPRDDVDGLKAWDFDGGPVV